MTNVVSLHAATVGDGFKVQCDDVLTAAVGKLEQACVVGIDADGELYVAGSHGAPDSAFILQRALHVLIGSNVVR